MKRIFMQKSLSCFASGLESFHLHVHSADRRNADQVSPGPRGEVGEDGEEEDNGEDDGVDNVRHPPVLLET